MELAWWWFAFGAVIAIGMDLAYRYSPNRLHGLLAAGACLYHLQYSNGQQILLQIGMLVGMVVLATCMFAFGWMRGGDAKALMAMSCWVVPGDWFIWLWTIAMLAGVLALVLLLHETWLQGWSWLLRWLHLALLRKPDLQRTPMRLQVPLVYAIVTATWLHRVGLG